MITNWVANRKMKELLSSISVSMGEDVFEMKPEQLNRLFFPSFRQVKDCIIISDSPVDKLEKAFDQVVKMMYMDKTGYEASNTETRINCYFENYISMELGTKIALMALEVWILQLKSMEAQSNFCLIMSCNEDHVEIRFHKMHENEKMWLDEELENYKDGAVGYVIV